MKNQATGISSQQPIIIGLMSGTSLDGLDLAACRFWQPEAGGWQYEVLASQAIAYPPALSNQLRGAMELPGLELMLLDRSLGQYFGAQVQKFCRRHQLEAQWVASHGHTVFHQPRQGLSLQIGHGYSLMAAANLPVMSDFRSLDVALGGQGAPLVPIGDELLFGNYPYCLNLGGIANISYTQEGQRRAFDVCPANGVLNWLAAKEGMAYDADGQLAAQGQLVPELLHQLNGLPFYKQDGPKSLGAEWLQETVFPTLKQHQQHSVADLSYTFCHHMAYQIQQSLSTGPEQPTRMLVTGGGAFHRTFISLLQNQVASQKVEVVVPDKQTVEFKEAIIFAFLGQLRLLGRANSLSSVTGAQRNSVGGAIYTELAQL